MGRRGPQELSEQMANIQRLLEGHFASDERVLADIRQTLQQQGADHKAFRTEYLEFREEFVEHRAAFVAHRDKYDEEQETWRKKLLDSTGQPAAQIVGAPLTNGNLTRVVYVVIGATLAVQAILEAARHVGPTLGKLLR